MGSGICLSSKKGQKIRNGQIMNNHKINEVLDIIFQHHKKVLILEIENIIPCIDTAIHKIIRTHAAVSILKVFEEMDRRKLNKNCFKIEIQLFEMKFRALEAYFMYLNDLESLKLAHDTKYQLICEHLNESNNTVIQLEKYYKIIKGTYQLQGYKELRSIFEAEKSVMITILDTQYEENMNKLKAIYSKISNTYIIDSEVYSRTLGALSGDFQSIIPLMG